MASKKKTQGRKVVARRKPSSQTEFLRWFEERIPAKHGRLQPVEYYNKKIDDLEFELRLLRDKRDAALVHENRLWAAQEAWDAAREKS